MSNQLNLPQVNSNQVFRNFSRMINGNWMHLSSISSLIAKGLNISVILFYKFAKLSEPVFALSLWGIV
jgi:hypothetical protein